MSKSSGSDMNFHRLSENNENNNNGTNRNPGHWNSYLQHTYKLLQDEHTSSLSHSQREQTNSSGQHEGMHSAFHSVGRAKVARELNFIGINDSTMNKLKELGKAFYNASEAWEVHKNFKHAALYYEAAIKINDILSAYEETKTQWHIEPGNNLITQWNDFKMGSSDNSAILAGRYILNKNLNARDALKLPSSDTIQLLQQQDSLESV